MTKSAPGSVSRHEPVIEVGLVCPVGTSSAGLHGLSDLFTYAGAMVAKRRSAGSSSAVRVVHWTADSGGDVRCTYDSAPGAPSTPSVLVVPGNERAVSGFPEGNAVTRWLQEAHANGVVIAAVCGGVFILAQTGLVDGRQVTTHWALRDRFEQLFPDVLIETDRMVIDYGDVITAGGVLAWADLGLRLTERFLGPTVMLETARYMNIDPPGRDQRFYSEFNPRTLHGDRMILKAQTWLSTHREHPIRVADLARHVHLAPRTFLRRFVKATGLRPTEYHQRLRISRAREVLEFSRTSISEVATSVGYEDVAGFRRVFTRIMGLTPSDYRRRFRSPGAHDA